MSLQDLFGDLKDKYKLERITEDYNLDVDLPQGSLSELFFALRHWGIIYNGKRTYNAVSSWIDHPDTELNTEHSGRITLYSGSNLVNSGVVDLYEVVRRFGCWFVINRTNSDKVEIDIWSVGGQPWKKEKEQ